MMKQKLWEGGASQKLTLIQGFTCKGFIMHILEGRLVRERGGKATGRRKEMCTLRPSPKDRSQGGLWSINYW